MSRAGGGEVFVAPGADLEIAGQVDAGRAPSPLKRLHHEEPPVDLESGLAEEAGCVPDGCSSSCDSMRSTWGELSSVSEDA